MEVDKQEPQTWIKQAVEDLQERLREASARHTLQQDRLFSDLLCKLACASFGSQGGLSGRGQASEEIVFSCDDIEPLQARAPPGELLSNSGCSLTSDQLNPCLSRSLTKVMPEFKLAGLGGGLAPTKSSLADDLDRAEAYESNFLRNRMRTVAKGLRYYESIQEPKRSGPLAEFVRSQWFSSACVLCIGLNALFIAHTTDFEIQHLGTSPGLSIAIIELCFMAFYTIELILKLVVHRAYFFCNSDMAWNLIDVLLVGFSVMDVAVMFVTEGSGHGSAVTLNLSFLRLVRVFKIAKVLRIFRTLRFFTELRLMLDCVLGSFVSLFWCLVLLFFVMYVFALLLVQGLTQSLSEDLRLEEELPSDINKMRRFFGSVSTAMLTLLQSTTNGVDWGEVYVVLAGVGGYLPMVYIFYILFFVIAAWNIVTSTFVDKALKLAQPDLETLTRDQLLKDIADAEELMNLFSEADLDGSSSISFEEFMHVSEHRKFRAYLHVRGIDIKNAEVFFEMLRTLGDDKEVDLNVLVSTLIRMKGFATSIDLHSLSFETKMLSRKQYAFMEESAERLRSIELAVSKLIGRAAPDKAVFQTSL